MSLASSGLAALGGKPIRRNAWPRWPRADQSTEDALKKVLRSERWTISGPCTSDFPFERRFAEAFAEFHGAPHCVPTTSGSSALVIALEALGVGPGQEVLVPGLTWVACASAVTRIGAVPVLVDVDPLTLCMSAEAAKKAITPSTSAIMLVHLYCMLADLDQFVELSASTGIPLLEDCSHAHGATWHGRKVGTFGSIGVFSMQQTKVLTSGEGGATITNSLDLYDRLQQLRADGRRYSVKYVLGDPALEPAGDIQGYNYCLSEFHAAILLDRLPFLEQENALRRSNALLLTRRLEEIEEIHPLHEISPSRKPAYFRYCIRFDLSSLGGISIEIVAAALSAELGISVHSIYDPLNHNRLFRSPLPFGIAGSDGLQRSYDPSRFSLPVATVARREVVAIPHNALLGSLAEVDDIVNAVEKVLRCRDDLINLS